MSTQTPDAPTCEHPESQWEIEPRDPDVGIFFDSIWCSVCGAEARDIEEGYVDEEGHYHATVIREWEPLVRTSCCGAVLPETETTLLSVGSSPTCLDYYGCRQKRAIVPTRPARTRAASASSLEP